MTSVFSRISGSVMARLALIFGAMAVMTALAIVVGWIVFQSIAQNMTVLSQDRLPELRKSEDVLAAAAKTHVALEEIMIASGQEDLMKAEALRADVVRDLEVSIESLPDPERASVELLVSDVADALLSLISARVDDFNSTKTVAAAVENALILSTEATILLEEASDNAYFDLVLGGEETITNIGETLTRLIEEDFALYQNTLGVKSEINLLSGLALSRSQTRDPAFLSILDDLSNGASSRLNAMLEKISANPATRDLAVTIDEAGKTFVNRTSRVSPETILSLRQKIESQLASVLDDINFELVIRSDDAMTGNETAVRKLLDEQVAQIREQATLALATRSFFASVMQVALARDEIELNTRTEKLQLTRQRLADAMQTQGPEIAAKLNAILAIADPETGISVTRRTAFKAQADAAGAARDATDSVQKISVAVSRFALGTREEINNTALALDREVQLARVRMQNIGLVSLALVALAPLLIWLMITRTLNRVTQTTERLAQGDLSAITGLPQNRGEIGRMAAALKVFRDGALERIRMQEEEKRRDAEIQEAEQRAAQAEQQAAKQARAEKEQRKAEARKRAEAEAAREEQSRQQAEAERKARLDEQELIVSELARGLGRLSAGDLSHVITAEFPSAYDSLRQDFNAAISNLAAMIHSIGETAGTVDASSAEIASSSLDLSRRTENTAATLEETAAALNELTESVSSATQGASAAKSTVDSVKEDAEASHEVMREAVGAMGEIEKSSARINGVVEVIDAIAFQTNLLALNAGVEAARAGDAGRGFAVVASEVRVLAQRCSEAALEINDLVSNATSQVERGVDMIDRTNAVLEKMITGVSDVSQRVAQIEVSAIEQSSGIGQLNAAVLELDRSTQQNAAMFEETTAASQALTREAQKLSEVVGGFSITHQDAAPSLPPAAEDTITDAA